MSASPVESSQQSPLLEVVWRKLHPAVPRHWLFMFAGVIWIGVGFLLCFRTVAWLAPFGLRIEVLLEGTGLLLAGAGYFFVFSSIVGKNIARIHALPERVCAFAFAAWKGYFMIGLMITIGVTLRNSSLPKEYLAVPYTAMGGMLLIGSQRFFRQFLAVALRKQ